MSTWRSHSALALIVAMLVLGTGRPLSAQGTGGEYPDDRWAAIAERVPGFAGWWRDGDTAVVMLVDTTRRADAVKAIAPELRGRHIRTIRVQRADFDFKELRDWKHAVPLDTVYHMAMVDADEVRNRIVVGVTDSSYIGSARRHLLTLGIPARALVMTVDYVVTR